jgi:ParB-like chromosome segregation protein Spo0J
MVHGVLEPVIIHQNGDDIEVVAGRGRVKAAIEANIRLTNEGKLPIMMPIIPRKGDDSNLYGILISENEVRREDSAINKGEKMRKLRNMGHTVRQISVLFGTSRQNVENMLAIDDMAPEVKAAIEAEKITATAALELRNLSRDEQVATIEALSTSGEKLTISTVKEIAQNGAFKAETSDLGTNRYITEKFKPQSKKRLEKRLKLFQDSGFKSDRYLQTKPADFQEGFAYALKWALGQEREEVDFDELEILENTENYAENSDVIKSEE